jgi:ENTS family enterobactin (siderophore) exporter
VALLRNFVIDTRPLRSRPFRWLILGQFGVQFSRQLLVVAVPYQVFVQTGSTFLVGLLGLLQVGPVLVSSLLGGVIADAYDRRGVLIVTQLLTAATTFGLAFNSHLGLVWPVFVLATLNGAFAAVESPARTAMVPSLTSMGELPAAFALNQLLNRTMQVVGPAIGGLVLAVAGIAPAYLVACGWAVFAACAIRPIGRQRTDVPAGGLTFEALAAGFRYVRRTPVLVQTLLVDFNAMVFGMPRAIFPLIGTSLLGGGAGTVGLLYAAPGAGAMLAALTMGWVHAVRRQGRLVVWSVVAWGISIAAFGLSRWLVLSFFLLAVAGAADVVSNVFRTTILQAAVPDQLRGRVTAFKNSLTTTGPLLGDAETGVAASAFGPTIAIVSGGLISILGAVVVGIGGGALWRQESEPDPE